MNLADSTGLQEALPKKKKPAVRKITFTADPDNAEWYETLSARTGSDVINRAIREYRSKPPVEQTVEALQKQIERIANELKNRKT